MAKVELFTKITGSNNKLGKVFLVGAGPGDPDLLTVKALRLIQQADVVLYDYLISDEIKSLIPGSAIKVSVGKKAGAHSVAQADINKLLVKYANKGLDVCRLKGGDPFIFGRGGEELEEVARQNIPFEVVPAVTAAAGCAAYAGIPLTHRDHVQGVQLVTGHSQVNGRSPDWNALAQSNQTLVIYMGALKSQGISDALVAAGMKPSMPVAIIEKGTCKNQRVLTGEISKLAQVIASENVKSPALIIVGEVVKFHQQLSWFEQQLETETNTIELAI